MSVEYSPLCNTNIAAYIAYCFATSYGTNFKQLVQDDGGNDVNKGGSGGSGHGGDVVSLFTRLCGSSATGLAGLHDVVADSGVGGDFGGVAGVGCGGAARAAIGMAVGNDGGSECVVDNSVHDGSDGVGQSSELRGTEPEAQRVVPNAVGAGKERRRERRRLMRAKVRADCAGSHCDQGAGLKPAWLAAKSVEREDIDGAVKESVKRKWIAKNELQAMEAERKLALLKASSVEDAVKAESTRVRAAVESNMVRIEKSHAFLSSTGNVPGEGVLRRGDDAIASGTVETVVSGCSISPDSSASQGDFRAAQKKILDQEAQLAEQAKLFRKHTGISFEALRVRDKETFTDNSENAVIMNELFGEAYVCHNDIKDGKRVIRIGPEDPW